MTKHTDTTAESLKSFIERLERLDQDKQDIADDMKEVFSECKSAGFDNAVIRQVLKLRKLDSAERQEQEDLLETYMASLGMHPSETAT